MINIPQRVNRICIVGAGHAAHVLIGLISASRPEDSFSSPAVTVLAPYKDYAARIGSAVESGITVVHPDQSSTTGRPVLVTKDPAAALHGVQLVLIPLPSFVVPSMLDLIADHLAPGTCVGVFPTQAGQQWIAPRILDMSPEGKNIKFFGIDKLPFACRVIDFGRSVQVFGYKTAVGLACTPIDTMLATRFIGILHQFIPRVSFLTVDNFLVMSLSPGNSCVHPARMYGLFGDNRATRRKVSPLFYGDMDDLSASYIAAVSKEIGAVARAVEEQSTAMGARLDMSGVLSVQEVATKIYSPTDTSTLARTFTSSAETAKIKAPMKEVVGEGGAVEYECDWSSRFFSEDIPALCMLHGIGELCDVPTPTTDMLIRWGQKVSSQNVIFLRDDGTLNENVSQGQSSAPQLWGIDTFEKLLAVHM